MSLINVLEVKVFETFQVVRDFSFLYINHLVQPQKINHHFIESKQNNEVVPHSVHTTTTITIIQSHIKKR